MMKKQAVIPGRDEVANPESITTIVSMDSGLRFAHPGMTKGDTGCVIGAR
jgi:hypothetical protein